MPLTRITGDNIQSDSNAFNLGVTTATSITAQNLNVSGLSTFSGGLTIGTGVTISGGIITATSITGTSIAATNITGTNVNISGVSTVTTLLGTNLSYTGFSTFSGGLAVGTGVTISGGIVTATSFSGALTGNVIGNVNAAGLSTFSGGIQIGRAHV